MTYSISSVLRLNIMSSKLLAIIMTNSLMNISKVLAEQSANTQLTENSKLDPTAISKLNYEVMYKMLEGEVEKLILENTGNPLIDDFKQKIVNKFSYLIHKLNS